MQYANVGKSGLVVSRLGLGMMSYGNTSRRAWHLGFEAAEPIVRCAAEGGITLFDTADMYDLGASEVVTGRLLRAIFADREEYVLATKLYYPMSDASNDRGLSRKHIFAAVDASLRRLNTDYIDLYQIHRWDHATPIEETMDALHDIVKSGKIRYLGASSMFAWQFAACCATHRRTCRYYTVHFHAEPLQPCLPRGRTGDDSLLQGDQHRASRLQSPRAWSSRPLADQQHNDNDDAVVEALREISDARGLQPSQVALAWLLAKETVTSPTIGATDVLHLTSALAWADIALSPTETEQLEEPYRPRAVVEHD